MYETLEVRNTDSVVDSRGDTPVKRPLSVLVVDDEPSIGEAIAELLEEEGYPVVTVRGGLEALRAVHRLPAPRVALVDLRMPMMDGKTLLAAFRAQPALADLGIVVITAGQPVPLEGAGIHLQKPFDAEELLAAMAASLEPLRVGRAG
jgi:CheY-like chemotaxis protein